MMAKKCRTFTAKCYSFISILVENPEAVFALTEQRISERMVVNGWLTKREIKVKRSAGLYNYEATVVNFVPTVDGLEKYNALHKLLALGASLEDIKKAISGEEISKKLKKKLLF